jgi:glycosyltransferase involved in cell wall biosynthesis
MRIGLSTSVIQGGKTGIAGYVFELLRALVAEGDKHEFVLFILERDLPLFEFLEKAARLTLVPVAERYRAPLRDILWHQQILPGLVRKHRLDVLHVPSYRRLVWSKPCPTVATVHDLAAFRVPKKYDWKRMFYGRVVARQLARRQDAIIAISQTTAQDIATFWKLDGEKVTVIYHGMDRRRFTPGPTEEAKAAVRQRFGLDRPFFLYVSRLEHPAKNHLHLIQAFERFQAEAASPWELVLAGSDWHGAEFIHGAIQCSPCLARIRRLGFVADTDLPLLYRAAGAFVYPSLYEGFGLPPLEAMACGCPVICSAAGALSEVVGDAALTIDPRNVGQLTRHLGRVAGDAGERSRLRAAGLRRAAEFDWCRTAARTVEVYERVGRAAGGRRDKVAAGSSP